MMMKKGIITALTAMVISLLSIQVFAGKHSHIKTAALTYSLTDEIGADFVGRHYDMAINPGGLNYDIIKMADPEILTLTYLTISTYRGDDYQLLQDFCNMRGYDYDSMFLWVSQDRVCIEAIAPAGPPCSSSVCTSAGYRLEYCGWNSMRMAPDPRRPQVWEFFIYKYLQGMGSLYDGVFEDECVNLLHPSWQIPAVAMAFPLQESKWTAGAASYINGFEGMSHLEVRDSILACKQEGWLPELMDTLNHLGRLRFPNPAAYGVLGSDVIDEVLFNGSGVCTGEGMHLSPILGASYYNDHVWEIMDTISTSSGYAIICNEINTSESLSVGSWARCQMERLSWYYMAADTGHFWFLLTGNCPDIGANDYRAGDSIYKWIPAIERDIGQPVGGRYVAREGYDNRGQYYKLYRRDYQQAIVLHRKASGAIYDSTSAVDYALEGRYVPLYADGSTGNVTSEVSIRNCEGMILIPADETHISLMVDTIAVDYAGYLINSGGEEAVIDIDVDFIAPGKVLYDVGLDRYEVHITPGDTLYMPSWGAVANPEAGSYTLVARAVDSATGELIDSCSFTISVK